MRAAHMDTQWLLDDSGELTGICLGYDFCAEHEWGTSGLRHAFGVPVTDLPIGLSDRQTTKVSDRLVYAEFERTPVDKRRKKQRVALLVMPDGCYNIPAEKYLEHRELDFLSEPGNSWYKPEHDLVCAWGQNDFGILVRGEANIARLKKLHEAFLACDIVFAAGLTWWVFQRGLSFMIASRVSPEIRQKVLGEDQARKRPQAVV